MLGSKRTRSWALLTAALLGFGLLAAPPALAATGDVGVEGPSHSGTGTPTGTKRAESVLWYNDGSWWGNLWDTASADFHIFRFDASLQTWIDTGVATEKRANTHHDVLWDGSTLYVASHLFVNDGVAPVAGYPTTLYRYSYDSSTNKYTLLGTSHINNYKTETLTIEKDTEGRLWATWQQGKKIWLNVTGTDGATWGTPFAHPDTQNSGSLANTSVDDTSALVAFGPGKVGLMWSRQVGDATDGFYWSVHQDGAPVDAWSSPSAVVSGQKSGDDHMNLKWLDSSGGRVFAAVKTSFTSAAQPLIELLALNATDGTWTAHTIAPVSACPNRVIALIDEQQQQLRTFATYPKPTGTTNSGVCTSSGGAIYEKSVALGDIKPGFNFPSDKTARIVDADQYVHNVSSTKQNLNNGLPGGANTANSGVLVLADVNATARYWHYYSGGSGTPPGPDTTAPTVTSVTPADRAVNVAATTNVTSTFSEAMDPASLTTQTFTLSAGTTAVPATMSYDGASKTATLDPASDLTAGATYTATVRSGAVKDAAGNALAADTTWSFAVGGSGTTEQIVSLTPTADSYVSSGATGTNYGGSTALDVDASPVEVSYLKFDLAPYAGRTVNSATLQVRASTNASTGKQNVKLVNDNAWTETGLNYGNRPALGTVLGTLGPTSTNTDYTVTLPAGGLQGQVSLSLGLDSASSDGLALASRETATPPKLVMKLAP